MEELCFALKLKLSLGGKEDAAYLLSDKVSEQIGSLYKIALWTYLAGALYCARNRRGRGDERCCDCVVVIYCEIKSRMRSRQLDITIH
ncbi:hypothetical protein GE061_012789 [Apolygus lucorum]|uniref:Uncharacterized protein n=1 Tax=Apolygus lucorum TaxID=248454 RepID=A0A8S9XVI4_APOLU|nr:hypothetical protein GE061_012789 [Apolygus lucorum]